jgi:hypothetical protein
MMHRIVDWVASQTFVTVATDSEVVYGSPSYREGCCGVLKKHPASLVVYVCLYNLASMRCYGIYTLGGKVPVGSLPNHLELIHRGTVAERKPVAFP